MVRKHTPAELETAQRILKERAPHMKKMLDTINQEKVEASKTISMLERRTRTQTTNLELEGGDTIEIFSRMSESGLKEIDAIEEERMEIIREAGIIIDQVRAGTYSAEDVQRMQREVSGLFDRAADCWLKVIAKITVDPAITFEWLKENPDKYSSEDIADAYLAYKETRKQQIAERADRVNRAINFRKVITGQGVHPVPPLDGDQGPAGVGGVTPGDSGNVD